MVNFAKIDFSSGGTGGPCTGEARAPFMGEGAGAEYPYLGIAEVGLGRVGLYGDSNCLDSSHQVQACTAMLFQMLAYVMEVLTPLRRTV